MASARGNDGPGRLAGDERRRPTVFLHIGEPKTGTTFLQQVMWHNRDVLAAQGVVLPGHHPQDHYRATQDLRGLVKLPSDPAGSWTGEWDILARQARMARGTAVISHELFCAADAEQAQHAVRSLQPADVHIVVTVRDIAGLLPAEWQESVKHRTTRGYQDWLGDVIDRESADPDRRQFWFWRVHDTLAILALWAAQVPADHIHVITTAPRGSSSSVLWDRFAALIGVQAGSVDLSGARANASLGLPEIEFMRRLNTALSDEVPGWFYMWQVKEVLAHQGLADRPRTTRLVLPDDRMAWAKEYGQTLTDGLRTAGYDLVGDYSDLMARPADEPAVSPDDLPADQVLDAAVEAAAELVLHQYRKDYPAARPQPVLPRLSGLAGQIETKMAASPRLKRAVRDLSSRSSAVRRLRVAAWRAMEWSRTRKHAGT
jgi:hypothetical protein